jgi:broad specificity phosphatase PhoE
MSLSSDAPFTLDPFLSRKDGAAELYLIRHGDAFPEEHEQLLPETTYDNPPLNRLGHEQARKLAAYINDVQFKAIYASPLIRTHETAKPLAELQGLPIQLVEDLREIELTGVLQTIGEKPPAHTKAMREQIDKVVRMAAQAGSWSAVPGAEPSASFRQRITNTIDEIAAQHGGERVAIVTHGGVINMYIADLLGMNRDFFFPVVNTSVTIVRIKADTRVLVSLNDTGHLK